MRVLLVALMISVAGCTKSSQPMDWLITDEAGDAPAGSDILEASVVHSIPREVRLQLSEPPAGDVQIQVVLAGSDGVYSLTAQGSEFFAAYTCDGCGPGQVEDVGSGSRRGVHISWTLDAPDLTGDWYARTVDTSNVCTLDKAGSEADNGIPPC